MDVLDLSRLQFALTTIFHFVFVVVALGLAPVVAILQTRWAITGSPVAERLTRFWGQLYIVNYAMGIAVGIILEFQFGLHWSGLADLAGDVFGAPLAIETLMAFFLESTFLALWIFGWGRLNRWVHTGVFWLVVITGYLSMFWVMVANGFLQGPVGQVVEDGVIRIKDFGALLTNEQTIGALLHIVPVCLLTVGVVMVGICSWHFLRGTPDLDFFRRSLRIGVIVGAIGALFTVGNGFAQFAYVSDAKLVLVGGNQADEVAEFQADMAAQFGPGDWAPPDWVTFAWPVMEQLGFFYLLIFFALLLLLIKNGFDRARPAFFRRFWHRFYVWTIPLPLVAVVCGWLVREVGRQPWMIVGELTVADAVSSNSFGAVLTSLIVFTTIFVVLAAITWGLMARLARRGPHGLVLGSDFAGLSELEGDEPDASDERDEVRV